MRSSFTRLRISISSSAPLSPDFCRFELFRFLYFEIGRAPRRYRDSSRDAGQHIEIAKWRGSARWAQQRENHLRVAGELHKDPTPDGLVAADEYDADGRAVADIRWVVGKGRLLPLTTLGTIIVLHRDPADSRILCRLEMEEALSLFSTNWYFNPHLLVRDARKTTLRNRYIGELLDRTDCYLLNTTGTPKETQEQIRKVIELKGK